MYTKEGAENGYRPGFTNDDLMKLVFQRYGKSEEKGDSEKVNKREALEPVPEDEEDINQKRAYPRPVPGSNSILAKHNEVSFKNKIPIYHGSKQGNITIVCNSYRWTQILNFIYAFIKGVSIPTLE